MRVPRALGEKVTLTLQLEGAANVCPFAQVVPPAEIAKSDAFGPAIVIALVAASVIVPLAAVRVAACGALVVPVVCVLKVKLVG